MKPIFILLFCSINLFAYCQKEKNPYSKFGRITEKELKTKTYSIDKKADAVILCNAGSSTIEGSTKGKFRMVTSIHTIIHILNKNAFNEANIEIPIYADIKNAITISGLAASTYNLENGKVAETKLKKQDQYTETIDKNRKVIKFTFPEVKEGSIIEYAYSIYSDFITEIVPWYFQSTTYPTLWSEYTFTAPEFLNYNFFNHVHLKFLHNTRTERIIKFLVSDFTMSVISPAFTFYSPVFDYRWVIKNAPKFKPENHVASIQNNISRMEFQLVSQTEPLAFKNYLTSWQDVTRGLLKAEGFGQILNSDNSWMANTIKPLYAGLDDPAQIAKKLFEYVRDNFKCTGDSGIYLAHPLENVFSTKQGSVPEINLLLTSMLRYAGLDANPVLLSTKEHGSSTESIAQLTSMNYIAVQLKDDNESYYLDATKPKLGFNHLPLNCYNGHAIIVDTIGTPLYFAADSLQESKSSVIYISNKDDNKWGGKITENAGYFESYQIRNEIAKKGKEAFVMEMQNKFGPTVSLSDCTIDSLNNYEEPVVITYKIDFSLAGEDVLHIDPTFGEGYKKNPFEEAERIYPVEMPFAQEKNIIATIEVPRGYKVNELPKQMMVKLDEEGKSFFDYRISQSGNIISIRNRLKISKAFFHPEEYRMLRDFFELVVKKQSEQIVLKKSK